jgi:hypothetical protein
MTATTSERIWASGNERTPMIFSEFNNTNVGYRIRKDDRFTLDVDLMNDFMNEDKIVYLTGTYDVVVNTPSAWDDVIPVWFDITNCLTSEFSAPNKTGENPSFLVPE